MSERILSHTYGNGLVLIAQPMDWLQSAAFTFLVPAGCVFDPVDRGGLGSFTCEMAMRGAGPRDSRQFVLDLDNLGVERSESVYDSHTSFSGATLAENLPSALEIFSDVLRRPHLPADQLEAARLVSLQEVRAVEDEPAHKVMVEVRRRHYPKPWGRPAYGEEQSVQATELADIRRFVETHYGPQETLLGVAGRFDWEQLKDKIGSLLGDWEGGGKPAIVEQPAQRAYCHLPYDSNQTQIAIAYDSVPYGHDDYFRAWGAVRALSGGMSARLFTEVRERRGLCYSVYASYHSLRQRGAVFCYAGTSAQRAQETLDVTLAELRRLRQGINPHELERLKARAKSSLIMQQESSSARSGSIARDWYHLGRARTMAELNALIDQLTAESVNTYLAENPPRDFTVVTVGPRPLEVPVGVS